MKKKYEYHGISLAIITGYLVELGGTRVGEDSFKGKGWSATLTRGEPFPLGALRLETVHVHFEGEESALNRVLALFNLRTIRAGG